ncbi:MAG: HAD-IA family hydrolase [Clostridia bacterium]|nr:HAD-IA family hydrolase [Clostridia bacterium]
MKKVRTGIRDARIYIASNGATVNAKGRIASTGLGQYIDGLFVSEDMGAAKPDAAFFDLILEKIREPRETCVMIGDSLTSDMLGAKNASLKSVWFMPSGNAEEAMPDTISTGAPLTSANCIRCLKNGRTAGNDRRLPAD